MLKSGRFCMHHRVRFIPLFVCLLTLAACGGTTTANSSPTATPTAAQPKPTNTPATGLTVYTSPDHKYQLSYPAGWQVNVADGNPGKVDFSGQNQDFQIS